MHEVIQLQAEIAGAVAQRAKLAEALSAADQRIRDLTRRLEQLNGAARSEFTLVPTSSAAKVSLFRKLFRGRADVWPRMWHSAKTGKKGYSPVCGNEWRDGICIKPAKKCSACPHQAWLPLTDTVIQDHLQGRHTAGVYAMLSDETCAFLAADFDEASWQADVMAYCRAGLAKGIDVAVEKSRSGKGAHAWVFFEQPVPAATARKLGFLLLTAASAAHPGLSLQSYDRLFPSQDLMPKGGFGNLIALPLQHGPRQTGNSVFVDAELQPYSDQWAFLAGIRRLGLDELANLVMAAERDNAILGLPNWPEEERDQPWQRPPSGAKPKPIPGPLPAVVHAVLAQRCFVPIAGLPPQLVDRMRRLAAFSNPAFHQKQAMRLPVAHIPRIIACGQLDGEFLSLPRGMVEPVRELLMGLGVKLQVCDERQPGTAVTATFKGSLRPGQRAALDAVLAHDFGILVAPPGSGKTVLGAALIAARQRSTLVLVHTQVLVTQWREQLSRFLSLPAEEIGIIAGGQRKITGRIDVATLQSLVRDDGVDDAVAAYGHVIVDESHHVSAVTYERVLSAVRPTFVTGLTATPRRRDGLQPIAEMQLGPIRHVIVAEQETGSLPVHRRLVVRPTAFPTESLPHEASIQEIYAAMAQDRGRNLLIAQDILAAIAEERRVIVLTNRVEQLDWLAAHLHQQGAEVVAMHGKLKAKQQKAAMQAWHSTDGPVGRVLVATGSYVGEGFDDPLLNTLVMAAPLSWRGTLVQYVGRLTRLSPGKQDLLVYDYLDAEVPALRRMFAKRRTGYRAIGFEVDGLAQAAAIESGQSDPQETPQTAMLLV